MGWSESPVMASSRISAEHLQQYSDLAVTWMQEYLRVDTTNPPGNEMQAVEFYKKISGCRKGLRTGCSSTRRGEGICGRGLPHTTAGEAKRPIILLNHMDVVTSDASHWKVPPFSGEIRDGYIWGRGAQDMKDEGLAQLVVMVMLKREKVALDRDVIFLAVSDEEADGTGTRLVHQEPARPAGECGVPDQRGRGESAGERQGEVSWASMWGRRRPTGCMWWRMGGRGMDRGRIRIRRRTGWCAR